MAGINEPDGDRDSVLSAAGRAASTWSPIPCLGPGGPGQIHSPLCSMKVRMPRMLLTECAEGQERGRLTWAAETGAAPAWPPILVPEAETALG